MSKELVGLAAVVMTLAIPFAWMYTYFRLSKLRAEERLGAIARGINVPISSEPSESMRSRRSGTILVAGAVGYIVTFLVVSLMEPDALVATPFGLIPLAVGCGFFHDAKMVRRDEQAAG